MSDHLKGADSTRCSARVRHRALEALPVSRRADYPIYREVLVLLIMPDRRFSPSAGRLAWCVLAGRSSSRPCGEGGQEDVRPLAETTVRLARECASAGAARLEVVAYGVPG
jgi:hypothetical protein